MIHISELDVIFFRAFQNGADHSDKVEEPEEEKHENGDGTFKVTCLFRAKALPIFVSMFDLSL